jgi:heat shock protein HslJ
MRRTALLLCATMLLAAAGCARPGTGSPNDAGSPNGTASPNPGIRVWPEGREFRSTSVTESGAERPLVAGTQVTIRFRAPGELEVYAGCNHLGVHVRLEGERMVAYDYLSTAIGCVEERLNQDKWLIDFFNAGPTWRTSSNEVTLRAGTTEIVLTDTAPAR